LWVGYFAGLKSIIIEFQPSLNLPHNTFLARENEAARAADAAREANGAASF